MSYALTREGIDYRVSLNSRIPFVVGLLEWTRRPMPDGSTRIGHDAETFFRTIYVRGPSMPANMHAHEFQHVKQFVAQPWTFWLRYLVESIRSGYPKPPAYDVGNRFETEAYAIELSPAAVATFISL